MTRTTQEVYRGEVETGVTVFHLLDSEVMPIGLKLKWRGFTGIFDANEDFLRQGTGHISEFGSGYRFIPLSA